MAQVPRWPKFPVAQVLRWPKFSGGPSSQVPKFPVAQVPGGPSSQVAQVPRCSSSRWPKFPVAQVPSGRSSQWPKVSWPKFTRLLILALRALSCIAHVSLLNMAFYANRVEHLVAISALLLWPMDASDVQGEIARCAESFTALKTLV